MKPYRWIIWVLFLVSWSFALLRPIPEPLVRTTEQFVSRQVIGKTLHVCAYACLAILTGWLRAPLRFRPLLMLFIMAHGTLTELGQSLVPGRVGALLDVGIDNAGVLLGVLLSWKWWTSD